MREPEPNCYNDNLHAYLLTQPSTSEFESGQVSASLRMKPLRLRDGRIHMNSKLKNSQYLFNDNNMDNSLTTTTMRTTSEATDGMNAALLRVSRHFKASGAWKVQKSAKKMRLNAAFYSVKLAFCVFFALLSATMALQADILEALMLESLRNNLVQACDGETITLHCPRNTHVLVQTAFYGRLVPSSELCPAVVGSAASSTSALYMFPFARDDADKRKKKNNNNNVNDDDGDDDDVSLASLNADVDDENFSGTSQTSSDNGRPTTTRLDGASHLMALAKRAAAENNSNATTKNVFAPPNVMEDTSCDMAEAHTRLVEACRSKRKCRIIIRPSFFGERDVCPTTRKYLQVSYKCKPISFEDQNFCEGTTMQLNCKPNKRLSIYSAQYGRMVNEQAIHCSSSASAAAASSSPAASAQRPVTKDCVFDVLPQVLRRCHAQAGCALGVDDHFLGNPCAPMNVQKHLSLIYMCVNEEVFSESALKGTLDAMRQLEDEAAKSRKRKDEDAKSSATQNPQDMPDEPEDEDVDEDYEYASDDEKNVFLHKRVHSEAEKKRDEESKRTSEEGRDKTTKANEKKYEATVVGMSAKEDDESADGAKMKAKTDVMDVQGLGFAEDFSTFVKYLKENHEEGMLYFFLFVSAGIIIFLVVCICCQFRHKPREKRRFGPFSASQLFVSARQGNKQRRKFFGTTRNYQTVSVSSRGICAPSLSTAASSSSSSGSASSTSSTSSAAHFYRNKLTDADGGGSGGAPTANQHGEPTTTQTANNMWRRPASVASCRRIPYTARVAALGAQHENADANSLIGNHASLAHSDSDRAAGNNGTYASAYAPYWDTYGNSSYGMVGHANNAATGCGSGMINASYFKSPMDNKYMVGMGKRNISKSYGGVNHGSQFADSTTWSYGRGNNFACMNTVMNDAFSNDGAQNRRAPIVPSFSGGLIGAHTSSDLNSGLRRGAETFGTSSALAANASVEYAPLNAVIDGGCATRSGINYANHHYAGVITSATSASYAPCTSTETTTLPRIPISLHHYN